MLITRRSLLAGTGAALVAACAPAVSPVLPTRSAAQTLAPDLQPVPRADFSAWVARFRLRARAAGISDATLDAAFAGAGYIPGVVARDGTQIQTRRTLEEYLSIATSDERIAKGRAAFARHEATLRAIEDRYGVDRLIVAAIWGMESTFGEKRGAIPVVSSTATLAFDGRRGAFYESQLIAALRILQRGDTTPERLTGSWAGAMGHTQFIPTSFESFAVDFTGDGRRDIWGDDPSDALASTASYLARNGWRTGLKWGAEAGTGGPEGRTIQPQAGGVRFTVTRNFNVLKTYNNSDLYALGIGHLADRIGGAGPLRGSFPPDANGLTRDDRLALQRGLVARGYDLGTVDGVIGARTEAAIRDFQTRQGVAVTGRATRDVLDLLR
ncbi:lytic murein transglycosylase [Pseudooctadecabacter jejudonensis]|uniref:Membrane-bound lytic murein transglycosylase B n=1 Tax=Pseudooctadecabacter jejudonensis TaxID=1391910 RepID=A0A1Y5SSH4_9RHOB|nr:lytic murein transglycosylase [Pseudooctadecabacter jejudonensis]SLN45460.1 Membrane-bound lytic murein transglycosylase B precursor [Pseudooctadecabacter jejudonensis]